MAKTQVISIPDFMSQHRIPSPPVLKHDLLLLLGFGTSVMVLNLLAHNTLTVFDPAQTLINALQPYFPDASITTVSHTGLSNPSDTSGYHHVISRKFDESIWPIIVDIGVTLGTVSAGMGVYRIIRGDVTEGGKLFTRAAVGTFLLYMIEPAFELISVVGEQFARGFHP